MPALAKPPVRIPRFKPHARTGANAGAGVFSNRETTPSTSEATSRPIPGQNPGEGLDQLVHDARNMLSGLALYCDLLAAPGVLVPEHRHYALELEGIAKAATQIIEKMARSVAQATAIPETHPQILSPNARPVAAPLSFAPMPVTDTAAEVRRLRPLLTALVGPSVRLSVDTMPCPGPTALSVEDLTRVLVNLVRNASDAMPAGGRVRITAQYGGGFSFLASIGGTLAPNTSLESPVNALMPMDGLSAPRTVLLTVADSGPGIPAALRERVFDSGFTTRDGDSADCPATGHNWPAPRRRGLGLNIVRNLVESAGGAIRVAPDTACGTRFEITLPILEPITSGTCPTRLYSTYVADSRAKGCIECQ